MKCSKCTIKELPGCCHNKPLICQICVQSAVDERDAVKAEIEAKAAEEKHGNNRYLLGWNEGFDEAIKICSKPISSREAPET